MPTSTLVRSVREKNGLSQADLGRMVFCSDKTISAVEQGRRRLSPGSLVCLAQKLEAPELLMEAAHEVTGGVFASPYLDGECVDLHRSSVHAKLKQEIREALDLLEALDLVNHPRQDDYSRRQVKETLLQLIDVRVAIDNCLVVLSPQYRINVTDLFSDHEKKLRERGYLGSRR